MDWNLTIVGSELILLATAALLIVVDLIFREKGGYQIPEILTLLNKKMTLEAFDEKVTFLLSYGIGVRAFILLRPPFMTEEEGIEWARRSLDHAFNAGVGSCVIIPVRSGNGAIDRLEREGFFSPPSIDALTKVMEYGLSLKKGLVFADMWDIDRFIPENLPAGPVKMMFLMVVVVRKSISSE